MIRGQTQDEKANNLTVGILYLSGGYFYNLVGTHDLLEETHQDWKDRFPCSDGLKRKVRIMDSILRHYFRHRESGTSQLSDLV